MAFTLEAIKYDGGKLRILNQLLLPCESVYEEIETVEDAWNAIRKMKVRGAPAIAIVGTLSVAVELRNSKFITMQALKEFVESNFKYLVTARPTAVNIAEAASKYIQKTLYLTGSCSNPSKARDEIVLEMEKMLEEDIKSNRIMGDYGAEDIARRLNGEKAIILTHCNTGSLATAGYGTALGVVRSLHNRGILDRVYCTETRPYNQGARLTAYELVHDKIPATLICDSMGALLMKERKISAVVVGADRIVSNGDTANKIGTFQLAITAQYHHIPFYVAAPVSTIDFSLSVGDQIKIEERPSDEMLFMAGKRVAAEGVDCWNPAFDVTPATLITGGIVTEKGVFAANNLQSILT